MTPFPTMIFGNDRFRIMKMISTMQMMSFMKEILTMRTMMTRTKKGEC